MKRAVQKWATRIKNQTWVWNDTISVGNVLHMRNLLNDIVGTDVGTGIGSVSSGVVNINPKLYGFSFLWNTQTNSNMGCDGYDDYQCPKGENGEPLYWRRMWTGGRFDYLGASPSESQLRSCVERIESVRHLKNNTFVRIERDFISEGSVFMRELRTLVYTNDPFQPTTTNNNLSLRKESNDMNLRKESINLSTKTEAANLNLKTGSSNVTQPKLDFQVKCRFSLNHIMRYNFLTYNLHKIHYDKEYCLLEGFPNVIVSGPFMVLVLLHYFASNFPDFNIKSFNYKNSLPCYIDTDLTLGIVSMKNGYELRLLQENDVLCSGRVE